MVGVDGHHRLQQPGHEALLAGGRDDGRDILGQALAREAAVVAVVRKAAGGEALALTKLPCVVNLVGFRS